jgi:hypothetical protein
MMLPNVPLTNTYINSSEGYKSSDIMIPRYHDIKVKSDNKDHHNCSWRCVDHLHRRIYCRCSCHKYCFKSKAQIRRIEEKAEKKIARYIANKLLSRKDSSNSNTPPLPSGDGRVIAAATATKASEVALTH